jgi:hypothetical protein
MERGHIKETVGKVMKVAATQFSFLTLLSSSLLHDKCLCPQPPYIPSMTQSSTRLVMTGASRMEPNSSRTDKLSDREGLCMVMRHHSIPMQYVVLLSSCEFENTLRAIRTGQKRHAVPSDLGLLKVRDPCTRMALAQQSLAACDHRSHHPCTSHCANDLRVLPFVVANGMQEVMIRVPKEEAGNM